MSLVGEHVDKEKDMISVQEWAEIRRLHLAEGMGKKTEGGWGTGLVLRAPRP